MQSSLPSHEAVAIDHPRPEAQDREPSVAERLPPEPASLPEGLVGGPDDDEHPHEHWPTCRRWIAASLEGDDLDVAQFLAHRARLRALLPGLISGMEQGRDVAETLALLRESADILIDWAGDVEMSPSLDLAYRVSDLERFAQWIREGRPPETMPAIRVVTVDEQMRRIHPRRMARAERRASEEESRAYWRERAALRPKEDAENLAKYPVKEPLSAIHPRYRVEAERSGTIGLGASLLADVHRIVGAGRVGEVSHLLAEVAGGIPAEERCPHPFEQVVRDEIGFPKCGACGVRVTCTDEQEDELDAQEFAWLEGQSASEGGDPGAAVTLGEA